MSTSFLLACCFSVVGFVNANTERQPTASDGEHPAARTPSTKHPANLGLLAKGKRQKRFTSKKSAMSLLLKNQRIPRASGQKKVRKSARKETVKIVISMFAYSKQSCICAFVICVYKSYDMSLCTCTIDSYSIRNEDCRRLHP